MNVQEYSENMGRINMPAETLIELVGKPLTEQAERFVIETVKSTNGAAGARSSSEFSPIGKCYAVKSVIVRNGVLVGVEFAGRYGRVYGFLDEFCNIEYSTYYDNQNCQTHSTDCVLRIRSAD